MDTHFAMAKFGLETKETTHTKTKSCSYYLKYVLLCISIIQFLIILGLVLFMVYGNAHASTEERLNTVEILNAKLLDNIRTLKSQVQSYRINFTYAVMEKNECYFYLEEQNQESIKMNYTMLLQRIRINELTTLSKQKKCVPCNEHIQKLNNSCFADKNSMLSEFQIYMENCTREMDEKLTLISQIKRLKTSCAIIEDKFKMELNHLQEIFESSVRRYIPDIFFNDCQTQFYYVLQTCKPLPNFIIANVDQALIHLRQHVSSTLEENQQVHDQLRKCNDELLQKKKLQLFSIQTNRVSGYPNVFDDNIRSKI
uniref:Uncharacterized protein n=1 Tax=Leptobrachium leishanense TaxID=445787 RepID=A0A8C5QQU3_9ANUR